MNRSRQWTLGAKLALVAAPVLLAALCAIATLLYMSWQVQGGAAAVNEAGRMRMRTYQIVLSARTPDVQVLSQQVAEFEHSLQLLRSGDAERPLFVPWDSAMRERFAVVERDWADFHGRLAGSRLPGAAGTADLGAHAVSFTSHIDAFVAGIEAHLSRWTALMHLLQVAMVGIALIGAAALIHTGYRFVLEPLGLLKQAIHRLQEGDLGARVARTSSDEFATLADGFNDMAEQLRSVHRDLEGRVQEKTAQLEQERGRLECLYEVTTLAVKAATLDELAHGFTKSIARIAHADGVALRWSDEANRRYLMLASQGLPQAMTDAEHCLAAGDCLCGSAPAAPGARVILIRTVQPMRMEHCAQAGFETVVTIPIRLHDRLMGEVDLFFHARVTISEAERSLLESLTVHLAGAMENLRLNSLGLEAAISQERGLLARELQECDAHPEFKRVLAQAREEDLVEFTSVAGLPARAVATRWLKSYLKAEAKLQGVAHVKPRCTLAFDCLAQCGLRDGLAGWGQFCIDTQLAAALRGDVKKGLFFRGVGALPFGEQIRSVRELMARMLTRHDAALSLQRRCGNCGSAAPAKASSAEPTLPDFCSAPRIFLKSGR